MMPELKRVTCDYCYHELARAFGCLLLTILAERTRPLMHSVLFRGLRRERRAFEILPCARAVPRSIVLLRPRNLEFEKVNKVMADLVLVSRPPPAPSRLL